MTSARTVDESLRKLIACGFFVLLLSTPALQAETPREQIEACAIKHSLSLSNRLGCIEKAWEASNQAMQASHKSALATVNFDAQVALVKAGDLAVDAERAAVQAATKEVAKEQRESLSAFTDALHTAWSQIGKLPNIGGWNNIAFDVASGWVFFNSSDRAFHGIDFSSVESVTLEIDGLTSPVLRFKARASMNWMGFKASNGEFVKAKSLVIEAGHINKKQLLESAERAIKAYSPQ